MGYQKNTWVIYDNGIPAHEQPDAFITKNKLDNIESGIKSAVTDFQLGSVSKGTEVQCEIISDVDDPSIKRINLVIPKEVSWVFSKAELTDQSVAPLGVALNDMVLDGKGNIFTVTQNINGTYILQKRLNIKGEPGDTGLTGPPGQPGMDGNKWIYADINASDGDDAPEGYKVGDFILDSKGDVFEILDTLKLHHLFNLKGDPGIEGKSVYQVWLEAGNTGTEDDFIRSIQGPAGDSTYDLWKRLGHEGTPKDFLESLKGDDGVVGKDGTKWIYVDQDTFDIDSISDCNVDDFIINNNCDVFKVLDDHSLQRILNIKGKDYHLEIGQVSTGKKASAEIVDNKLNLIIPAGATGAKGETGPEGPPGESTYSIWKALGNTGDARDFLDYIKGEPGYTPVKGVDYLTENDMLTTLDEVLANEEEGKFVDALVVKEMYLKLQRMIINMGGVIRK